MNVTTTTNVSNNFKTKMNFTSNNKQHEISSDRQSTGKALMCATTAVALGAIVIGGIMFAKGKGYKVLEGQDDFGNKTLDKLTKKGQLIERKIFREDGKTLSRIEHFTDGIRRKATYLNDDGKTTSFIAEYAGGPTK